MRPSSTKRGTLFSTGTNEVPKAGGDVYGEAFSAGATVDHRCIFRETPFCSSNVEQNKIIDELFEAFRTFSRIKKKRVS